MQAHTWEAAAVSQIRHDGYQPGARTPRTSFRLRGCNPPQLTRICGETKLKIRYDAALCEFRVAGRVSGLLARASRQRIMPSGQKKEPKVKGRSKDRPVQNCAPGQSIRRARSTGCVVRCAVEGRASTGSEAHIRRSFSMVSAFWPQRNLLGVRRTSNVQGHNADLRRRRLAVERLPSYQV